MTMLFSVMMALWTVLFIDFWERKQSRLQFEWGTFDFEKELEANRIDFERSVKKYKKNLITGVMNFLNNRSLKILSMN
jgi:hypothetical protein